MKIFYIITGFLFLSSVSFSYAGVHFPTPPGLTSDINKAWWISYFKPKNVRQLFGTTTPPINFGQLCNDLLKRYKLQNKNYGYFIWHGKDGEERYNLTAIGAYGPTKRTDTGVQSNHGCQFYWKGMSKGHVTKRSQAYYIAR